MGKSIELDSLKALSLNEMKAKDMKKELTLRGVSTDGLFEKNDLKAKLEEAREQNVERVDQFSQAASPDVEPSPPPSSPTPTPKQVDELSKMKVGELKAELDSYGVAYSDLFEKSEFVDRVRECRSNGAEKVGRGTSVANGDVGEWKDVETVKMNSGGGGGQGQGQGQPQEGGGPFGGGMGGMGGMGGGMNMADLASMFGGGSGGGGGGMGGMNMQDIMGMMGNMGGGSPGGGMGGMQEMASKIMQNPKAQGIIAKAQKNPKIMSAVTECMGNPAAFAKYQNDPEIKEILDELRQIM
ncbi:hypothetical protein TrCOL_g6305 [Triparma columacea]|uniref:ARMET C-terminal domain-containing protein n=1 Tax=Triparma columacea TaxID=722753 RepID=A0A9W7GE52_9STRA|nr:hypothetical protein TrCOL_g6305 [Triparma columacea]